MFECFFDGFRLTEEELEIESRLDHYRKRRREVIAEIRQAFEDCCDEQPDSHQYARWCEEVYWESVLWKKVEYFEGRISDILEEKLVPDFLDRVFVGVFNCLHKCVTKKSLPGLVSKDKAMGS